MKFTPTEKLGKNKNLPAGEPSQSGHDSPSTGEDSLVPDVSQGSAGGSFRFRYSKNETYQLFLSHSSKKVRLNTSHREYNGIFFKLTKPPL